MPGNTERQRKNRKDAIFSACFFSVLCALSCGTLLWLSLHIVREGAGKAALLIGALVDLGMIIPIQISLKTRLKEIQGGEEDAAAQY